MALIPLENIKKVVPNVYEAVVIAAKEARRINLRRKEEDRDRCVSENGIEKATTEALKKLTSGKIKHSYRLDEGLPIGE